jgi:hypothetical protein
MATIKYKDPATNQWVEIPTGVTVDSALSNTSENPVQNKVITSALNGKVDNTTHAAQGTYGLVQIWLNNTDNYLYIKTEG